MKVDVAGRRAREREKYEGVGERGAEGKDSAFSSACSDQRMAGDEGGLDCTVIPADLDAGLQVVGDGVQLLVRVARDVHLVAGPNLTAT